MSTYTLDELRHLAVDHADALCLELAGGWQRVKQPPTHAAITRGDCELHFFCHQQDDTVLLDIQAQLPQGWTTVAGAHPPVITVNAERDAEAIAVDIARHLLPAHTEAAARVHTALTAEAKRQTVTEPITDHFLKRMPGAVPDPHHSATAASSTGPAPFTSTLRVNQDTATVDLHLRDFPVEYARALIDLTAEQLTGEPESPAAADQAIDAQHHTNPAATDPAP